MSQTKTVIVFEGFFSISDNVKSIPIRMLQSKSLLRHTLQVKSKHL